MRIELRFECPLCGRNKFDRDKQPHICNNNYRKKLPPFILIEEKRYEEKNGIRL
jgi:hypothetical protein